jgi:hypothetical protein
MPFRTSGVCFASSAPGTVADIVAVQNTAALATMLTAAMTASFKHRHTISSLAAKHCSNPVIPPRIVIWLTWTEFPFVSGGFVTACKERDQAMSPFIPALWDLFLLPTKQGSSAVGQSLVDAALKTPSTLRNWVVRVGGFRDCGPGGQKRCVEMENVTGARELTRTRPNPISSNGMARIECLTLAVARRPLDVRHWRRTRRNAEILERPGLTQVCEIS